MKAKYLSLVIAVLLAAGALWLARTATRAPASEKTSMDVGLETSHGQSNRGQTLHTPPRLEPPNQTRRFTDFTPEQRVEFARKGHGPGG